MLRLLLFIVFLALVAPLVLQLPGGNPLGPSIEGQQVVLRTGDLEVHFDRYGPTSETYMLFGGSDAERKNSVANVVLAGLAIRHASHLSQRYPKFHMCSSPGAAQAQQLVENMALVAADGRARSTLRKALARHDRAIAKGGERVCLSISGEQISLRSAKHRDGGFDLTEQMKQGYRQTDFYYVSGASIEDCEPLL